MLLGAAFRQRHIVEGVLGRVNGAVKERRIYHGMVEESEMSNLRISEVGEIAVELESSVVVANEVRSLVHGEYD